MCMGCYNLKLAGYVRVYHVISVVCSMPRSSKPGWERYNPYLVLLDMVIGQCLLSTVGRANACSSCPKQEGW